MGSLKSYRWPILLLGILIVSSIVKPEFGSKAFEITGLNLLEMLKVLPPIFLILGLLDVWVPKEMMIRYMGKGSGIKGVLLAFIMGAAAAGPLYAAFPVAHMLLKKEASLFNIFIFIGAWSTTKLPMLLFETSAMGIGFSASRLLLSIPVILIIALITNRTCSLKEQKLIYENAVTLAN